MRFRSSHSTNTASCFAAAGNLLGHIGHAGRLLPLAALLAAIAFVPLRARADSVGAPVNPTSLVIPALGVDAGVQYVGLADDGSMGVPDNFSDVAWYDLGVVPGQPGYAIFTGHVSSTAAPGPFYNIDNLGPGNTVHVIGDDGSEMIFTVNEVDTYSADDTPMDRMFAPSDQPGVVLITCGGDWDPVAHLFSNRIVVFATLSSDQ